MILETRARTPSAVAAAAARRRRRPWLGPSGRLMIIAADHPARGALGVGDRPLAMANRFDLLDRILVALERPGVNGVLATADVIEDLLLLEALDGRLAAASSLDGGKMLLRMDMDDPATAAALAACADAVSDLASRQVMAIIEPFIVRRAGQRTHNDLAAHAVIRSIAIASGLGVTSAYTWLKIPVVDDMERVAEASTLPTVLLGGESGDRPDEMFARWQKALRLPNVRGLAVGRNILYPPDDNVAAAVDTAVSLL